MKRTVITIIAILAVTLAGRTSAATKESFQGPDGLMKQQNYTGAIEGYNAIIAECADTNKTATGTATGLIAQANNGIYNCLRGAGSLTAALAFLDTSPSGVQPFYKGDVLLALGNTNAAIVVYQTQLPMHYECGDRLHSIYIANRDPISAGNLALKSLVSSAGTMRTWRDKLNQAAVIVDKTALKAQNKPFVGPNVLTRANALVAAENTGTGLKAALTALGFEIPEGFDAAAAKTLKEKNDVLAGWIQPSADFLGRLEFYLGVQAVNTFAAEYNSQTK